MSFRSRMKKTKADVKLGKRHNRGETTASTKGKYPTVINKNNLPIGVETWWCREGKHEVDIIPFFPGPDFPLDADGYPRAPEGEMTYKLDLFIHRDVGTMNKQYVCPHENFNEPCPICEYIMANKLEKEDWKKIAVKHRVFYLVWVHDEPRSENEKKGVQLWEVAAYFMEEKLEEISALPRGGGYEHFWHPDTGKTIAWTRKGTQKTDYIGHRFIDRERPIPDRILDQSFPIDSVINMHPSYEDIEKDFQGTLVKLNLVDKEDTDIENENHSVLDTAPDWIDDSPKKKRRKRPVDRTKKRKPISSQGKTIRRKKRPVKVRRKA